MGTHARIAIQNDDNTFTSIYLHWDGYTEGAGKILFENYFNENQVHALMNLGNLSSLDKSIECPNGHCFENSIAGYCVAYGRDRGEEHQEAQRHSSIYDFHFEEYNYLFKEGQWFLYRGKTKGWQPLQENF